MADIDSVVTDLNDVESGASSARDLIESAVEHMDAAEVGEFGEELRLTKDEKDLILDYLARAREALQGPRALQDIIAEVGEVERLWRGMTVES